MNDIIQKELEKFEKMDCTAIWLLAKNNEDFLVAKAQILAFKSFLTASLSRTVTSVLTEKIKEVEKLPEGTWSSMPENKFVSLQGVLTILKK